MAGAGHEPAGGRAATLASVAEAGLDAAFDGSLWWAVGRTKLADLPLSYSVTRLTVGAAAIAVPVRVEPVKEAISTCWREEMRAPTSGPVLFIRLKAPDGTPAAWQTSAKGMLEKGAISEGFRAIVQTAIRAGATLQAIWFIGQFHGVIRGGLCAVRFDMDSGKYRGSRKPARHCYCGAFSTRKFPDLRKSRLQCRLFGGTLGP